MPRLVCDSFNYAPYIIVQGIKSLLGSQNSLDKNDVVWEPILNQMTRMSQCTILLKNIWPFGHHNFHPQLHYIYQNAQRLPWLIQNQRLSSFNNCGGPRDAFFRVTLPRWHTRTFELWIVLSYIFCHNVNKLISGIQRIEIFPLLSAQREGLRRDSSIILRTWFQHRGHFENMTVY